MSAPGAGISIREFARRDGCNERLVRRALIGGFLIAAEGGGLDPALVGTSWRKSNRAAPAADKRADKRADMSAPPDDLADFGEDMIAALLSGKVFDLAQADRIKANALALRHVLAVRRTAGELVEAELAERILFDTARTMRDAWTNWPSRVGPLIATDLGVSIEAVIEALNLHVHRQLADLGEPDADFSGG